MVKPIKRSQPSEHTQKTVSTPKTPRPLQTLRDAVINFVTGRGKSALGAGRPSNITDNPPSKSSKRVSQAIAGSSVLPSSNKKRSR